MTLTSITPPLILCRICGSRTITDNATGYVVCPGCGTVYEEYRTYSLSYIDSQYTRPMASGKDIGVETVRGGYREYMGFIESLRSLISNLAASMGVPSDGVWNLASKYTEIWSGRMDTTIAEIFVLAYCIITNNEKCVERIRMSRPQRFRRLSKLAQYVVRKELGDDYGKVLVP